MFAHLSNILKQTGFFRSAVCALVLLCSVAFILKPGVDPSILKDSHPGAVPAGGVPHGNHEIGKTDSQNRSKAREDLPLNRQSIETEQPLTRSTRPPSKAPLSPEEARTIDILYATNRTIRRSDASFEFTSGRSSELSFGVSRVRVPDNHRGGKVERPWRVRIMSFEIGQAEDAHKHFTIRGLTEFDRDSFLDLVTQRNTALVFVHGYANSFEEGLYRLAQIVWDGRLFSVAPILFSWPSSNRIDDYVYDEGSAELSVDYFLELLKMLKASGIRTVHIIAHSMGNRIVLNAIAAGADKFKDQAFTEVVFAAPDVDRDLFVKLARKIRKATSSMTLYASASDRPLGLSSWLASMPRAGDVVEDGPTIVEGVESIDMTIMGSDMFSLNHSTFAESPVIEDIARLVLTRLHPPNLRTADIQGIPSAAKPTYWKYSGKRAY